ncbi:Calcium-activated chloride channel regulator 2 [Pseudolycoriella hygida]|uniref:Calcium-activated chloride channel regulator 2 n=1 Tax=Pseudolycoriella hygida TaxID=35572 RepID=A0A9Q0N2I6_9DIPT|nr:Calcium-activated chloride channel regulator 2 [Pseudolycoriella hygida]
MHIHSTIWQCEIYHIVMDAINLTTEVEISTNLKKTSNALPSASNFLFNALDGRAYMDSVIVMIPSSWPKNCLPQNATLLTSSGESSDITISERHPIYGDAIWTQQSAGCGENGDQIYASYSAFNRNTAGRELVREWAKYRYGIFDDIGYPNDPIYPMCHETHPLKIIGCSDWNIYDNELCNGDGDGPKNVTVDDTARSSIMFDAEKSNIVMFCDEETHNPYAPTKQNQMCNRQSTLDVILKHKDFKTNTPTVASTTIVNTTPKIVYKQRLLTRYVLVIDETIDTMVRESWSFLRTAIRKWVVHDLPENTEVGIILANDTASAKIFNISSLNIPRNRDFIASFIPFSPSESQSPGCVECAIKDGLRMLKKRYNENGPANSVILVVAPGMYRLTDVSKLASELNREKTKLVTINYPGVIRRQPLDGLAAAATSSSSYSVFEMKQNSEKTFLTTYFELCNVFYDIMVNHYEGSKLNFPIEIHRKELFDIHDDDSSSSPKKISRQITSTFMLDESMGTPSAFYVYTHNAENPLIQSMKLISPSGVSTAIRSDERLSLKQMSLSSVIGEAGTWTYTIDRINGNPQPHFVQVMASAKSATSPVIFARSWTSNKVDSIGALILYVEVKRGSLPVSSALVEAIVYRPDQQCNSTSRCHEKFRLLDTGSGDPDVLKGDGIYTRYLNVADKGSGVYKIDIIVTDNGNTAYSLPQNFNMNNSKCCGSSINIPSKQTLSPFQRYLPSLTVFVAPSHIHESQRNSVGRIGDLQAEILDATRVQLSWTSPDIGGFNVARYELKYALSVGDIVDNFDTAAILWTHDQPLAFSIGDDTSFGMDISKEPDLIGSNIYIALRAFTELSKDAMPGPVSNFVRVNIPNPVKPSVVPDSRSDSFEDDFNDGTRVIRPDNSSTKIAFLTWHSIVPIIAGVVLVLCLILIYCYFCVVRRRRQKNREHLKNTMKSQNIKEQVNTVDYNISSIMKNTVSISEPEPHPRLDDSDYNNIPDPHTIGLPIYGSDEEDHKRRLSFVVVDSNHQLIDQPSHQQIQRTMYRQSGVSVITSNTNSLARQDRMLNPHDSWTASQLLHEHERRHSPYDDNMKRNDLMHMGTDQGDQVSMNYQLFDHISLSSAPPVPPLPYQTASPYPVHLYNNEQRQIEQPPTYIASINQRFTNPQHPQFNSSLQGSMNSVNSGERKKTRNITMV